MDRAILVADYGFGDAGKGTIVDFLVGDEDASTVVRYNGGAQCAHNVVTDDGRHHTFAQFGSGTFRPDVKTYLSQFVKVNPDNLFIEEQALAKVGVTDAFARLTISPRAPITTPFHVAVNRLREIARGDGRHGSCGLGVGETVEDEIKHGMVIEADDFFHPLFEQKLDSLQTLKEIQADSLRSVLPITEEVCELQEILSNRDYINLFAETCKILGGLATIDDPILEGTVVFEGAQGVLLDQDYGFQPYTTWSDTTFRHAYDVIAEQTEYGEVSQTQIEKIGVVRAYATRHGAGPFPTEDADLADQIQEYHNGSNKWQGDFRVGYTDGVLLNYAMQVAGAPDKLAVTCLDILGHFDDWKFCNSYRHHPTNHDVHQILYVDKPTYACQEQLGNMLGECTPNYNEFGISEPNDIAWMLEESTGVPVGITSHGPRPQDKRRIL